MAQNLQKQGPSVLRNLIKSDLLHLVDLLISDKKWVEECPSEKFPFKLIRRTENGSFSDNHTSNGLKSIFLDTQSQSQSQSPPENREKKIQNLPSTGVSPPATLKNLESDNLDSPWEELGPVTHTNPKRKEMEGLSRKVKEASDNLDSPWEELGLVAHTNPKRKEMEGLSRKVKEINHDYETLSDDDFSESDGESLSSTGSEGHRKPRRVNGEDSSLLQILDSWHRSKEKERSSSKEDDTRKVASENVDGKGDCPRKGMMPSSSRGVGIQSDVHEGSCGRRLRPSKSYSFVSDQVGDGKDKLIDDILGSLKKSGERSAEARIQA